MLYLCGFSCLLFSYFAEFFIKLGPDFVLTAFTSGIKDAVALYTIQDGIKCQRCAVFVIGVRGET